MQLQKKTPGLVQRMRGRAASWKSEATSRSSASSMVKGTSHSEGYEGTTLKVRLIDDRRRLPELVPVK